MAVQTQSATASKGDLDVEQKIQKLRALFADAPERRRVLPAAKAPSLF